MDLEPEPEPVDSLHSLRAELKAALARIAELVTRAGEAERQVQEWQGLHEVESAHITELEAQHDAVSNEWRKAEARIARAVAELEQMPEGHFLHVVRALEALR